MLKNRAHFSSTMDIEILHKLKELSRTTMIPISKLTDKAFTLLLKEYEKEKHQD